MCACVVMCAQGVFQHHPPHHHHHPPLSPHPHPHRFTAGMMIFQYILANAGVARGFSGYFANLCGQATDFFIVAGYIDFLAFGLVLACTVLLVIGTKESAWFNNGALIWSGVGWVKWSGVVWGVMVWSGVYGMCYTCTSNANMHHLHAHMLTKTYTHMLTNLHTHVDQPTRTC